MSVIAQPARRVELEEGTLISDKRLRWAVVLLSLIVFLPVLGGELVWDDRMLANGSAIGGGRSFLKCFTQPFLWHFFRPLVSVSFFFERQLWRGEPLGYHLTNLLLHALATVVMLKLLDAAFRSRWTTIIGGALFAIHPVQVGAVAWIGGRTDSLSTLFVLLFLLWLVRAARSSVKESGKALALAVLFYNLAIYTKEQCLPILLLAPAAFAVWRPEAGVRLPRTSAFAAVPFLLSAVLFVTCGYFLGMPRPSPLPYSATEILTLAGSTVTYYGLLLLAPAPTWMHRISLEGLAGPLPAIVGLLLACFSAWVLFRWRRRDPASAWFLAGVWLLILPVSNLLPLPYLVVAPYRAALPWIGLAAVFGRIFGRALDGRIVRPLQASIPMAVACLLAWHAGLAAWGSMQWREETRIFAQIIRHDPGSIVARSTYSYSLERESRFREAVSTQEAAMDLVFRSEAWRDRETALDAIRLDPAISFRARRNQGSTDDPRIWIAGLYAQLANLHQRAGQNEAALKCLDIGQAVWSNHLRIHLGYAHYALERGDVSEAKRRYRMALAIDRDNAIAHQGMGLCYSRDGQWVDAAKEFAAWSALEPWNSEARKKLAEANSRTASAGPTGR